MWLLYAGPARNPWKGGANLTRVRAYGALK